MAKIEVSDIEQVQDVAAPEAVDVEHLTPVVCDTPPTKRQALYDSEGKPRKEITVLNKAVPFMFRADRLRREAFALILKPVSGLVLVQDAKGSILARFSSPAQASQYLKSAQVDVAKLKNNAVLQPPKKK